MLIDTRQSCFRSDVIPYFQASLLSLIWLTPPPDNLKPKLSEKEMSFNNQWKSIESDPTDFFFANTLRIIAVIDDAAVIRDMLKHLRL